VVEEEEGGGGGEEEEEEEEEDEEEHTVKTVSAAVILVVLTRCVLTFWIAETIADPVVGTAWGAYAWYSIYSRVQ
jgi:hypothetical protein